MLSLQFLCKLQQKLKNKTVSKLHFHMGSMIICLVCFASLSVAGAGLAPFSQNDIIQQPDYSKGSSWLKVPQENSRYEIDIFWVYPTILHDESHWLMDISIPELQTLAQKTISSQASVFAGQGNLYAPYYRQMNMAALSLPEGERIKLSSFGKDDIWRAFNYYLEHFNNGRPFILAGHSQGSSTLTDIIVERWGSIGCEDRLVAGYLIGWSITQADLEKNNALQICASSDQTNCFLSYNTVAEGMQSSAPTILEGAIVVNPLSWSIKPDMIHADQNSGAVFFADDNSRITIPHYTSAVIQDGGVVVQPVDPKYLETIKSSFPKGVYHVYDYSIFFENLRANAAERIQQFLMQR